jgi:outer membrane protein OmpA-like peptidoglycan-associated protein
MALLVVALPGGRPLGDGAEAGWSFERRDGACVLERPVPGYGTVRFAAAPGAPLRLEVLGNRQLFADGPVALYRVTPAWHPAHPQRTALGEVTERAGTGLLIGEPLATRVLNALHQGFEAHLLHDAWYGGEARVRLANVHLRRHHETFLQCLRSPVADGWSTFERTRIEHASGEAELGPEHRARLRRLAEYVRSDPAIERIYVDGHTDDVGSEWSNRALSRQRAEAVAAFLTEAGVPKNLLVVRFHGARYPVNRGTDAAARADNRRTTVRLERRWGEGSSVARR